MKISQLSSALAFGLALSAGQAHAEPWTVTVRNSLRSDLKTPQFANSPESYNYQKQSSGIIYAGKSGTVTFDKPSGVCVFDVWAVTTEGDPAVVFDFDVCKSKNITFSSENLNYFQTTEQNPDTKNPEKTKPWLYSVENESDELGPTFYITKVEFVPSGQAFTGINQISANIGLDKSGTATFNKPSDVCDFDAKVIFENEDGKSVSKKYNDINVCDDLSLYAD